MHRENKKRPTSVAGANRLLEGGSITGQHASRVLSAAPVLRKFFEDVVLPMGDADGEVHVFSLACECMQILQRSMRTGAEPDELYIATMRFSEAYLEQFGDSNWAPKFHLAMHIALQWMLIRRAAKRDNAFPLPNCFKLERRHKSVKKHVRDFLNTKAGNIERSLLEEVTLDHFASWADAASEFGLQTPHAANAATEHTLRDELRTDLPINVSVEYRCADGAVFGKGDVVMTEGGVVGKVLILFEVGGAELARIEEWRQLQWLPARREGVYRLLDSAIRNVACGSVRAAAIYKVRGSVAIALWPKLAL